DVTTHLVDLIQWECFPDQIIDYNKDIKVETARHWPTIISPSQFAEVTYMDSYPAYLQKYLTDSLLNVYCNGEINYRIKNVYAKVSVIWNFKAPDGTGDTHFSIMRGTKANLIIRQGKEENYKPVLYIEPINPGEDFNNIIYNTLGRIQNDYPGVRLKESPELWEVVIPDKYKISHEEHFAEVTERFLQYLKEGKLPEWEVPNMIAKYYTTITALEIAKNNTSDK
ncbi:MAG TPA: putative oxidoreductase C-terminal domain-containing protein, partial [Bacteroidales bacterium]|nr:putative oxidoreductase C-terminal domain-containing protein [Bacteroidales bacterium]